MLSLAAGNVWRLTERQRNEFQVSTWHHHVPALACGNGVRVLLCVFHPPSKRGKTCALFWRYFRLNLLQMKLMLTSNCLHQVLRPGVLWFLRNLNDPDFNPVQEMIHLPIYRHLRRFILSVVVFGSIVLLMLWLPIRLIKVLMPTFLPYNVMLYR